MLAFVNTFLYEFICRIRHTEEMSGIFEVALNSYIKFLVGCPSNEGSTQIINKVIHAMWIIC